MSVFACIEKEQTVEVFDLNKACAEDLHPLKVNVGVGAYRTEEGEPWILPVVKKAEMAVVADKSMNHEYLPVLGVKSYTNAATRLLLGQDSKALNENRAFGIQTVSGTGALRVGAEFLAQALKKTTFYYSSPSWANHHKVFANAGFTDARTYRYWDNEKLGVDFDAMMEDLNAAPEGAVVILHACAHNPTGSDPTHDQWRQIADIFEKNKLFPFFDSSYQGFASGDPDYDAFSIRYFVDRGFEMLCALSFAKIFGLYNERVGNLTIVQKDASTTAAISSQMTLLVRGMYSNPPAFGSRVVAHVLNDEKLRQEWLDCIHVMNSRIVKMRKLIVEELTRLKTPGSWDHITTQIGMFCFTGLNETQVKILIEEFHIYLTIAGRISMGGINEKNVIYVARAIHEVVTRTNCIN